MQVRRIICGRRGIDQRTVFSSSIHTHLKEYRGLEEKGEGEPFPINAPDQGLLQTSGAIPTTSPLPTMRKLSPPNFTIYLVLPQPPTNFGNTRNMYPGVGKHRFKRHLGFRRYLTAPHTKPRRGEKSAGKPLLPRFRLVFLSDVRGPLQAAVRRRLRNSDRKDKIRTIQNLLDNFGGKGKRLSCLKVLRQGTYLCNPTVKFPRADIGQRHQGSMSHWGTANLSPTPGVSTRRQRRRLERK